jgi:hypothetical protein
MDFTVDFLLVAAAWLQILVDKQKSCPFWGSLAISSGFWFASGLSIDRDLGCPHAKWVLNPKNEN